MSARLANLLGFFACVALLGYAYFAEFVQHLEPCPLCIFQRVGIFLTGVLFMIAAIHGPKAWGRRVYAVLIALAALLTMGVAIRHLWIQSQPPGTVASCGAPLQMMLKFFPLREVIAKVLAGSGECAQINWRFLGLAMPAWVLLAALGLGAFAVWANLRRARPVLRF
jgi:disulfide bond formation protein DsbB